MPDPVTPSRPVASRATVPDGAPAAAGAPRSVDSRALLGPRGELLILHRQQVYRLRVTALGKLILTK